MALSSLYLQRLHSRAQANLEEKLRIVPARTMPSQPDIDDIYAESVSPAVIRRCYGPSPLVFVSSIPNELQLPFIFSHYNAFARTNCTARKEASQSFALSKAIWYWDMDESHSFSSSRDTTRYNVILMTLVGMSANPNKYRKPEAETFMEAFVLAWVEGLQAGDQFSSRNKFLAIWKTGPWDLITFTDAQKERVGKSVGGLREKMRGAPEQKRLSKASEGVVRQFRGLRGAAFALHWCFMHRGEATTKSTPLSASQEYGVDSIVERDPSLMMESKFNLARVDWKDPLVVSLLVGIDRGVNNQGPILEKEHPFWMTVDDAIRLLEDECGEATDAMTALFEGLSMKNGSGDAMEL